MKGQKKKKQEQIKKNENEGCAGFSKEEHRARPKKRKHPMCLRPDITF